MIILKNVSKKYKDFLAVDNLNLEVEDGNIVALVGPNGAGKSSTINMLIGTSVISEGEISINGLSVERDLDKIKRQIGYVSDDENKFLKLKAIEYLNFVCDMYDISEKERRDRILTLSRKFNIEKDLNTMMDKFSKGMKQKIMIIASLLHKPKVWILDEPFTGLDPATSHELKNYMKEYAEKGNIVILIQKNTFCDVEPRKLKKKIVNTIMMALEFYYSIRMFSSTFYLWSVNGNEGGVLFKANYLSSINSNYSINIYNTKLINDIMDYCCYKEIKNKK